MPSTSRPSPTTLLINDKTIDDPMEIANLFNTYYISVAEDLRSSSSSSQLNYHDIETKADDTKFTIPFMTLDNVHDLFNNLDVNKATGLDGIPAYFLKISKTSTAQVILILCNLSIKTGIYPDMWKRAKLIPVYKGDSQVNRGNYRPISILAVVSKILERHVSISYSYYLNDNNIFSNCQHGFRAYHSCETSLITILESLLTTTEQGDMNGMLLIDFSKAFDLVDHLILLLKLTNYGISLAALNWFRSYLHERTQVVQIKGFLSEPKQVVTGVPQGSILGPLLFLVFINDMPSTVEASKPFLFADDSTLLARGDNEHTISYNLNLDLHHIAQWSIINNMILNLKKTKSIKIYSKRKFPDTTPLMVQLDNMLIEEVKKVSLLGTTLDCNLKWDYQINLIYNTINSRLYLFKRIRQSLPFKFRIQFYFSLIYPHLMYCCTIWGNARNELLNDLLILQKRAARLILEQDYRAPSINLFRQLKWIPIYNIIKMRKILLTFNSLKTSQPDDIRSLFTFRCESSSIYTRSSLTDLEIPFVKTEIAKSKLSFSGASLFNSLPDDLKIIANYTVISYKKNLKKFFIDLNYKVDHVNKFSCNACKHVVLCRCVSYQF